MHPLPRRFLSFALTLGLAVSLSAQTADLPPLTEARVAEATWDGVPTYVFTVTVDLPDTGKTVKAGLVSLRAYAGSRDLGANALPFKGLGRSYTFTLPATDRGVPLPLAMARTLGAVDLVLLVDENQNFRPDAGELTHRWNDAFHGVTVAVRPPAAEMSLFREFLPSDPGAAVLLSTNDLTKKLAVDYWLVSQQFFQPADGNVYAVYSLCNNIPKGNGRFWMGWLTFERDDQVGTALTTNRLSYTGDGDGEPSRFLRYVAVPSQATVGTTWTAEARVSARGGEPTHTLTWKVVSVGPKALPGLGQAKVLTVAVSDPAGALQGTFSLAAGIGLVALDLKTPGGKPVFTAAAKARQTFPPRPYSGTLTSGGQPLAGVILTPFRNAPFTGVSARTDADGQFQFPALYGKDLLMWMGFDRDGDGQIDHPSPLNTILRNMDKTPGPVAEKVDAKALAYMNDDQPPGVVRALADPTEYPARPFVYTLDPQTLLAVPESTPLREGITYAEVEAALLELYPDRIRPWTPGFKGPGQGWGDTGGGSLLGRAGGAVDFECSFIGTQDESSLFRFSACLVSGVVDGPQGKIRGPVLNGLGLGDPFDKTKVPAGAEKYFTLDKSGRITGIQILLNKLF